jgi:hypothetical protein
MPRKHSHSVCNVRTSSKHDVEQGANDGLETTAQIRICSRFIWQSIVALGKRSGCGFCILHATSFKDSFQISTLI